MLVQLYRDNYTTVPTENLITTIYNGFFDGVENWFLTAVVANTDLRTSDLTSLSTITKNQFNASISQSIKVSGFFRARKTGTYRFFTYSNDKNILEIDGDDIIVNNNLNQLSFANKSLIAGRYYSLNLYYGNRGLAYPPSALTGTNTTIYGEIYTVNASSVSGGNDAWRACSYTTDVNNYWRSNSVYSYGGVLATSGTKTTTDIGDVFGQFIEYILPVNISLQRFFIGNNRTSRLGPQSVVIACLNSSNAWVVIYQTNIVQRNTLITLDTPSIQSNRFRLIVRSAENNDYVEVSEWILYDTDANQPDLQCGYIEPNDDGTSSGSTNLNDFIIDATGLTTYYDINPETQPTVTTADYSLVIEDDTLQGLFRVSPLALYINRSNFVTSKHDIFYVASDELFNNFNGTYKNYIQLHEKPIAGDNERKRFTQFSSDMSFECQLDGRIEVRFRRGNFEPITWRYAMLILDVERIPVKNI